MHIVIASVFDPIPSDGISLGRYHHLSKTLREKGHHISYITSSFLHASKTFRAEGTEVSEGIIYYKIRALGYRRNNAPRRLLDHFIVARNAKIKISAIHSEEKIDLLLCASPPLFWCNFLLKFCASNGIKSVLDLQDNWPKAFKGMNPLLYWLTMNALPLNLIKKQNIQVAAAVTAVTADYLEGIVDKKQATFYHGAPVVKIQHALKTAATIESEKLRLVFMGHGSSHRYLLEFLETYKNEALEVGYIGNCDDKRITEHQLIHYYGPLYNEKLYPVLANHDYGLFIRDSYKEIKLPNKLFYYWACGLPVLGIDIEGEANEMIKNMNGVISNQEPINFFNLKLSLSPTRRQEIKEKALNRFEEKVIYLDFACFIEDLLTN